MGDVIRLRDTAQGRAEALVRRWQADCRPMADPTDLQELEDRISEALRANGQETSGSEK